MLVLLLLPLTAVAVVAVGFAVVAAVAVVAVVAVGFAVVAVVEVVGVD